MTGYIFSRTRFNNTTLRQEAERNLSFSCKLSLSKSSQITNIGHFEMKFLNPAMNRHEVLFGSCFENQVFSTKVKILSRKNYVHSDKRENCLLSQLLPSLSPQL